MEKVLKILSLGVQKREILSTMVVVCCVLWTGMSSVARAQLSPGDLSLVHRDLDGLRNCKKCHDFGNRQVQGKCLACHEEIKAMRSEGKGLHALEEFQTCVNCHVEHQGADYSLIYWDGGRDSFRHDPLGYTLEGKHAELQCRRCHTLKNITDPAKWRDRGKDLNRTFLGLDRACLSCHEDRHQGLLGTDCARCHDQTDWERQPGFDHARTDFPLAGRHRQVACTKCHRPDAADFVDAAEASPPISYRPLAHEACTDCHRDPHEKPLGNSCTECHSTAGWLKLANDTFDHGRTRYPLEGRHVDVACEKCHGTVSGDQGLRKPRFAACRDCHRDEHDAGGRGRPGWMTCESCHDVTGFRPARFKLARHNQGDFPLDGAHLAVACSACHGPDAAAGRERVDLAPPHSDCADCHRSPHGAGDATNAGIFADKSCNGCHVTRSWRDVTAAGGFNHDQTRFPLTGRHVAVACRSCHEPDPAAPEALLFDKASRNCNGCHRDVHGGQFAARTLSAGGLIDCGHCHVTTDWLAEKFDHETDARFVLRGGHERTPCADCHRLQTGPDGTQMVRYRPLDTECRSCHGDKPVERGSDS